MSDYNDLKKLEELRREGILTDEEFQDAKRRVLETPDPPSAWSGSPPAAPASSQWNEPVPPLPDTRPRSRSEQDLEPLPTLPSLQGGKGFLGFPKKNFLAGLHISQLLHFVWPLLGLLVPVIGWVMYKDRDSDADRHGRIIMNWLIPVVIVKYVCSWVPFLGGLAILVINIVTFIFAVYAALRAYMGGTPKYPFSLPIFKVKPEAPRPGNLISRFFP